MPVRVRRSVALLFAAGLGVGACASGDSSTASTADPVATPTTEVEEAAQAAEVTEATEDRATPPTSTSNEGDELDEASTTTTAATDAVDESGLLEVQVASGIFPMVPMENGSTPDLPAGAIERRIGHEGHNIFAIEIPGEGPPIVLAHGFPDSLHLWDEVFPLLAGRRVIAFDFIGWGRSDKPLPMIEYEFTTAAQVEELSAVIDAYDLTDVTLVVHDQSAPVGLEYLILDDSKIADLVFTNGFFGISSYLFPPKGIEIHDDPALRPVAIAINAEPAAVESLFRFQMNEFIVSSPNRERVVDTLWSQFPEARPAFVAMTDILVTEVIDRTTRVDRLGELDLPIDIVHGVADPYLTADLAREFDGLFANSTLTLVEEAGHYVQIDAPEIVAEQILDRRR